MALTAEAKKKQSEYMKQYRAQNRERVLQRQRDYYAQHKDKFKEYRETYWNKKAETVTE